MRWERGDVMADFFKETQPVYVLGRRTRIPQLDVIRALAIISVVMCHSVESFFYMYQDRSIFWGTLSIPYRLFDLFGITIGRMGVPLFLFLTGTLVLHKPMNDTKDCVQFYKKTYVPLFLTMWLWIIIWNIYLIWYRFMGGETTPVTVWSIIENLFFVRNVDTIMPAWYIPMILGVYIFLPFLMVIVKKISVSVMVFPFVLVGYVYFALPTINLFFSATGHSTLTSPTLDLGFSGGVYGLYILLGYWISEGGMRRIPSVLLALTSLGGGALCVYFMYFLANAGTFYKLEYNSLPLLMCCASIFALMLRMKIKAQLFLHVSKCISELSLAIFFLHNPIQYSIYLSGILMEVNRILAVLIIFILSFGLSVLIAWLLGHIKLIRQCLGVRYE